MEKEFDQKKREKRETCPQRFRISLGYSEGQEMAWHAVEKAMLSASFSTC